MALLVQKFGGTSVGSVERLQAVARRIADCKEDGNDLVIVVSAMGHTTDELTAKANAISSAPPQREMDMLLSTGEHMLFMEGGGRVVRVHGPFVDDGEVEAVANFLRQQGEPEYDDRVVEEVEIGSDGAADGAVPNNGDQPG